MNKKFGAWDKLQKKFLWPWPEGFHLFGEVTCFNLLGQQLKEFTPELGTLERLNDVEIVQFIGLKDIKEQEAFSGAIFKDGKGVIRTIFEVPGGFATESNPTAFGYGSQGNSNPSEAMSDQQMASWFEGTCEIIGNIFENSDLLIRK